MKNDPLSLLWPLASEGLKTELSGRSKALWGDTPLPHEREYTDKDKQELQDIIARYNPKNTYLVGIAMACPERQIQQAACEKIQEKYSLDYAVRMLKDDHLEPGIQPALTYNMENFWNLMLPFGIQVAS